MGKMYEHPQAQPNFTECTYYIGGYKDTINKWINKQINTITL